MLITHKYFSGRPHSPIGATRALLIALLITTPFATALPSLAQTGTTGGVIPQGQPADVVTGLNIPWSIVWAGDEALVSQRNTADILAFRAGETPRSIGQVPGVAARLDGGLLGLAVLEADGVTWIYAYHSTAADNRIIRLPYADGALGAVEVVLEGLPGGRGHNGGRIAFGPDGMLYAAVGEAQNPDLSQDPASLGGKIIRLTPGGDVPGDNPTAGSYVYSMGHRNPQGLTWDSEGHLWAAEFGNDIWDELNRIDPGANYGWPVVEGQAGNPDFVDPVMQWGTQESGPSGLTYIDGTFFLAGLTGQRIWAVTLDAEGVPVATDYFSGEFGRIRHVLEGPDHTLWFVTNNTDGRGDGPRDGDDRILSVPLVPAAP